MTIRIMFADAIIAIAYVVVSFSSAIRLRSAYGVYAHIEYTLAKWRRFGTWALKRLLLRLGRLAVLAIVVATVSAIVLLFVDDS